MSDFADRNLLYGILALQLDFVTRDQLIDAMNAWALEKETPLGDILLRNGSLDEESRQGLSRLVELHLKKHGGDARRSLAVASADQALGGLLSDLVDGELRRHLNTLRSLAG